MLINKLSKKSLKLKKLFNYYLLRYICIAMLLFIGMIPLLIEQFSNNFNIGICIISLVLVSIIIVFCAYKTAKNTDAETPEDFHVFGNIHSLHFKISQKLYPSVDLLFKDKYKLQYDYNKKLAYLQSNFINQLLTGRITDKKLIEGVCSELHIQLKPNDNMLIMIKLNNTKISEYEYAKEKTFIYENIFSSLNNNIHIHQLYVDELILVASIDNLQTEKYIIEQMENVFNSFIEKYKDVNILVSVGNIVSEMTFLYESFANEEKNLNMCINSNTSKFIKQEYNAKDFVMYTYPEEFENKLIDLMESDKEIDLNEIFDELLKINDHIVPNSNAYYLLMTELLLTYKKILLHVRKLFNDSFEIQNDLFNQAIVKMKTSKSQIALIHIYEELKKEILLKYTDKSRKLKFEILKFIEEECTNIEFNLAMVSEKFDMPSYLVSEYFINEFGVKFSKYIEELRMEKSNDMLDDTNLSVEEIALAVGYSGATSYRRAYKRNFNKLPRG